MRLRLTIRRHGLPETSILWPIDDSPSPTIADLLEAVNESVPIEAEEWGFEDYAVELKGYECLHYQRCGEVFREDDKVLIRPLLTQDIKTRKRSGRHQISADGYKLYDGLAYGKTLTRALVSRPEVKIPPRKRRRVTYHEDEDDDEEELFTSGSVRALAEKGEEEVPADSNRQLILHAEFDDDDDEGEDDDDFEPDEDEEGEGDCSRSSSSDEEEEQTGRYDIDTRQAAAEDEQTIQSVPDEATRAKIRKLHSAFPSSRMAVCNFVLIGTEGNIGEAYEALRRGFLAAKPKSAVTETFKGFEESPVPKKMSKGRKKALGVEVAEGDDAEAQVLPVPKTRPKFTKPSRALSESKSLVKDEGELLVPKTRLKGRKIFKSEQEMAIEHSEDLPEELPDAPNDLGEDLDDDSEDSQDEVDSRTKHYDQNGFPPGSIQGGKLITFGSEPLQPTSSRPTSSRRSNSIRSNKSVRSACDDGLINGLASMPLTDQEEQSDASSEVSSDTSSEGSSDEGETSSSEEDSSDSDSSDSDGSETKVVSKTTLPASDSDSSSDPSSDGDAPEEASSKVSFWKTTNSETASSRSNIIPKIHAQRIQAPGRGTTATQTRNRRRRNGQILQKLKDKGILPEDTTAREFLRLPDINLSSSSEEGSAALTRLRSTQPWANVSQDSADVALSQSQNFEARRRELLAALAAGGVEIGGDISQSAGGLSQEDSMASGINADVSPPQAQIVELPSVEETQLVTNSHARVEPQSTIRWQPDTPSFPKSQSDGASQPENNDRSTALENRPIALKGKDVTVNTSSPGERPPAALGLSASENLLASPQAQPASAEQRPVQRTKWDAGPGRRMLFSALGVKPPKDKDDEERVRQDLMKNIRPAPARKQKEEEPEVDDEEAVEKNPEAWRQKINYRAVECVQEAIVLSEPPFPFVQRWDPQQQRGGKRKNNQRDQTNNYEETRLSKKQKKRRGKHTYAQQQEYFDESYQPSYQDDSLNYDDDSQIIGLYDQDVDEASQQLLGDLQIPVADDSQDPEDLAPLPEDPSTLPILEVGNIRIGMTIAFKTLEMNAATQWQPLLSNYRTAIVLNIQDAEIHLTLAKRDRSQHHYDEETGERIYEKFEMPVDDDDEDDGMLITSFYGLHEPRIVQEAPTDYNDDALTVNGLEDGDNVSHANSLTLNREGAQEPTQSESQEELQDAQYSHVTETPVESDAPIPGVEGDLDNFQDRQKQQAAPNQHSAHVPGQYNDDKEFHDASGQEEESHRSAQAFRHANLREAIDKSSTASLTAKDRTASTELPNAISDETRQEISHLIKDAGFRSSIPSSITRDTRPNTVNTPGDAAVFERLLQDMEPRSDAPFSPNFHDYDTTPTGKRDATPTPQKKTRQLSPSSVPVQSGWVAVNELPSSPPAISSVKASEEVEQGSHVWETESEDQRSSSPVQNKSSKHNSIVPQRRKRVPIGAAQAVWEQLARLKSKSPPPAETVKPNSNFEPILPTTNENGTSATIFYPKLSTEPSFTSGMACNGRQPDLEFEESTVLSVEGVEEPEFERHKSAVSSQASVIEPESVLRKTPEAESDGSDVDGKPSQSSYETPAPHLPSKSPISARIAALMMSPAKVHASKHSQNSEKAVIKEAFIPPQDIDSDDDLPPLEQVLSQRSPKIEKTSPALATEHSDTKTRKQKKMANLSGHEDDSEGSAVSNRNSFRKSNKSMSTKLNFSESRPSADRASKAQDSHPAPLLELSASQRLGSQAGELFIDLTQSSDVEHEDEARPGTSAPSAASMLAVATDSDDEKPKKFNSYNLDSEEDWDPEVEAWVKGKKRKKTSSLVSVDGKRGKGRNGNGLRDSRQASLNTKGRKSSSQY